MLMRNTILMLFCFGLMLSSSWGWGGGASGGDAGGEGDAGGHNLAKRRRLTK